MTATSMHIQPHQYSKLNSNVYHVKITMFIIDSHNSSGLSTFTFASVVVNIVPHHCDCQLWQGSELWLHAGEKGRTGRERET